MKPIVEKELRIAIGIWLAGGLVLSGWYKPIVSYVVSFQRELYSWNPLNIADPLLLVVSVIGMAFLMLWFVRW